MNLHSLRFKLFAAMTLLVLLALLAMGMIGYRSAKDTLQEKSFDSMTALMEARKSQIEDYFQTIRQQVETFSQNLMVVEAMQDFKTSFKTVPTELAIEPDQQSINDQGLENYYLNEFLPRLNKNLVQPRSLNDFWPNRSETQTLQHLYISGNAHPLGSKDNLNDPGDGSLYSQHHAQYHPIIRNFLKQFGYYDIFLIDDETGDIVYSVFKEMDYATSLKTGPYRNTNFARVFQEAALATEASFVKLVDFEPYEPSYNAPAAFIASPIFKDGQRIGVLVFQMPIDRINAVMTANGRWKETGLGDSGETYLVGKDGLMRSQSRFLIEDKQNYLAALKRNGVSVATLSQIDNLDTSILQQPVETATSKAAFSGGIQQAIISDYRDVPVFSVAGPIGITDMNWVIVAEEDRDEVFEQIYRLQTTFIIVSIVIIVAVILIAVLLARAITKPVNSAAALFERLSQGEGDLTQRMDDQGKDEVAHMGRSFNLFINHIHGLIRDIVANIQILNSAVENVTAMADNLSNQAVSINKRANTVGDEMSDMSASLMQNSSQIKTTTEKMALIASSTEEMTSTTNEISNHLNTAAQNSRKAVTGVDVTKQRIESFSLATNEITSIVNFIEEIAAQTTLLALNATIESARAGEAGRGFSVVASEIKDLASEATKATEKIRTSMADIFKQAEQSIEKINETQASMQDIDEFLQGIASSVEEQSITTQDIAQNANIIASDVAESDERIALSTQSASNISQEMQEIRKVGNDLDEDSKSLSESAIRLRELEQQLSGLVGRFKI
jgi:methyl-accepting chemotaxis protein